VPRREHDVIEVVDHTVLRRGYFAA